MFNDLLHAYITTILIVLIFILRDSENASNPNSLYFISNNKIFNIVFIPALVNGIAYSQKPPYLNTNWSK